MNRIQEEWEKMRIAYQQRYIKFMKDSMNEEFSKMARDNARGHMLECCYVLISIYGLTDRQMRELEENYCGLTHFDIQM